MTLQYSTTVRNDKLDALEFGSINGCPTSTAAWGSSTAYTAKTSWVINDTGKVYLCTTSGTSAGSGGPTGTGSDITDGTAHWTYIGNLGIGFTPLLRLYTGSVPANCAASEVGTLLVSMTLPAAWLSAASAGVKSLNGTWTGTAAATGTAAHFRIYDSTGTTCHAQGTVTATGGGGDCTVDNTSVASGQTVTATSFSFTAGNS